MPAPAIFIPPTVTAEQFGAKKEIFERDIRGQFLPVLGSLENQKHIMLIQAGDDPVPYPLHVGELINFLNQN